MTKAKKDSSKVTHGVDYIEHNGVIYYATTPAQATASVTSTRISDDKITEIMANLNEFCKKKKINGLNFVHAVCLKKKEWKKENGDAIAEFLVDNYPEIKEHVMHALGVSSHSDKVLVFPISIEPEL